MIRYLHGTTNLPLNLRLDRTNIAKWWVYGFHGFPKYCRGQSGARSSTETDLAPAVEIMQHAVWKSYLLLSRIQGKGNHHVPRQK